MDLKEILWEDVDWINLAEDRENWWALVNAVIKPRGSSCTYFTEQAKFSNAAYL
jgi:hypothetical protein